MRGKVVQCTYLKYPTGSHHLAIALHNCVQFGVLSNIAVCCPLSLSYLLYKEKVKRFYLKEQGAGAGPYLGVVFDEDEISLDIPEDRLILHSGKSPLPLVYSTKIEII